MEQTPLSKVELFAGMDTHKDSIAVAVVNRWEEVVFEGVYPATMKGYEQIEQAFSDMNGISRVGIEGCSTYGRGICVHLLERDFEVFEVISPKRDHRRLGKNKNDAADAIRAACDVINPKKCSIPKGVDGFVSQLSILLCARAELVDEKRRLATMVKSLLVSAPAHVRDRFSGLSSKALMRKLSAMRPRQTCADYIVLTALKTCAVQWADAASRSDELASLIEDILQENVPDLLKINGVGAIHAARLLTAFGDDVSRIKGEAAFAALSGTSPVEASTGKNAGHYRLNRGGDRKLNSTIHQIVICRMCCDEKTKAYIEKRRREGKTKRDAIRCLKRYVAREMYRAIVRAFKTKSLRLNIA